MCAHQWISLEEAEGGIALFNDCKYGHDVSGGVMRLSLLHSPMAPDPEADPKLDPQNQVKYSRYANRIYNFISPIHIAFTPGGPSLGARFSLPR
jgi:alpha-mannosidase